MSEQNDWANTQGQNYTFLGEPTQFWVALRDSKTKNEIELIQEAVTLRAKVSYYEEKLKQMVTFGKLA